MGLIEYVNLCPQLGHAHTYIYNKDMTLTSRSYPGMNMGQYVYIYLQLGHYLDFKAIPWDEASADGICIPTCISTIRTSMNEIHQRAFMI